MSFLTPLKLLALSITLTLSLVNCNETSVGPSKIIILDFTAIPISKTTGEEIVSHPKVSSYADLIILIQPSLNSINYKVSSNARTEDPVPPSLEKRVKDIQVTSNKNYNATILKNQDLSTIISYTTSGLDGKELIIQEVNNLRPYLLTELRLALKTAPVLEQEHDITVKIIYEDDSFEAAEIQNLLIKK